MKLDLDVLRNLLPFLLCISNSAESIVLHDYGRNNSSNFSTTYLLLSAEIFRLFVYTFIFIAWVMFFSACNIKESFKSINHFTYNSVFNVSTFHYFVIALIYTISNNFGYRAISILEPVEYNILSTLKIPITVSLSAILIKTRDSSKFVRYTAALMVLCGNVMLFVPNMIFGFSSATGIILAVVYCFISALGAIYSELTMTTYEEHILVQSFKFSFFSLLFNYVISVSLDKNNHQNGAVSLNLETMIVILIICATGFLTSIVIKFNGGVAKSLSTSGSTALTMIIREYSSKTFVFYIGASASLLGVIVYSFPETLEKYITKRTENNYYNIFDDEFNEPETMYDSDFDETHFRYIQRL